MIVIQKKKIQITIVQDRSNSVSWIWVRSYKKKNLEYKMWHRIDDAEGRKGATIAIASMLKDFETKRASTWDALKGFILKIFN